MDKETLSHYSRYLSPFFCFPCCWSGTRTFAFHIWSWIRGSDAHRQQEDMAICTPWRHNPSWVHAWEDPQYTKDLVCSITIAALSPQ